MSLRNFFVTLLCASSLFVTSITQAAGLDTLTTLNGVTQSIANVPASSQIPDVAKKVSAALGSSKAIDLLTWIAQYNEKLVMDTIDYSNGVLLKIAQNEPVSMQDIQQDPKLKALAQEAVAPAEYAVDVTVFFGGWGIVLPVLLVVVAAQEVLSDISKGNTANATKLIQSFLDLTKQQIKQNLATTGSNS